MRSVLGPGAAFAAWVAVLVVLNVTGDPLVCAAAWAALGAVALRSGQRRLLLLSVVVGLGLVLVVPGVSLADGSFEFTFRQTGLPDDASGWLASVAAALRVPAQVLAAAYLALVPARLLLDAAARTSPDTALLGAIAARLHPLLARDIRLVRDELASRGLRVTTDAPVGERIGAAKALWEAVVSGLLDRAFVTAAALESRGWGAASPTGDDLRHPALRPPVGRDRRVDRALIATSLLAIIVASAARGAGALDGPVPGALLATWPPPGPAAIALALLLVGCAALAMRTARADDRLASRPVDEPSVPAMRPQPAPLTIVDASMRYPDSEAPALVGASLAIDPGELVVVTGPSGGGKSTLLDVITGTAPHATGGTRTGEVRLGDHVLGLVRADDRGRIASVFQHPESQVLVGIVAEEVAFGLRQTGRPIQEVEAAVLAVLDELDIRHLARRDCGTLSGGELQRVLLAAALAVDPAVLVLDEPTSQVDAATERRFWDAVDRVRRERGIGVLVAEHRLDALLGRADRVVHVVEGRVAATLLPAQVRDELPELLADPYADLAPLVPNPFGAPRLAVRVDRLTVGEHADARGSERTLLRNLAVALAPGSIVTLEGANGTGKSTLLRAIRGLHPGAFVQVDGRRRADVGASAGLLAWLSQGAGAMVPGRTVRDCAIEASVRLGVGEARALEALAAAGLEPHAHRHPGELSVGQRQRLALVAATSHRPPVWLLDEPTRGMDPRSRRWVALHVLAHAAAGGVVLVATHDPQLAAAIATHRLRLDSRTGPSLVPVARDRTGVVAPSTTPDRAAAPSPIAGVDE